MELILSELKRGRASDARLKMLLEQLEVLSHTSGAAAYNLAAALHGAFPGVPQDTEASAIAYARALTLLLPDPSSRERDLMLLGSVSALGYAL